MSLDSSWMSCRKLHYNEPRITGLPQFSVSHNFLPETTVGQLPVRTSCTRVIVLGSVAFACVVGIYVLALCTADPVVRRSTELSQRLQRVVGDAIAHANEQAERDAFMRYQARVEYMQRRKQGTRRMETDSLLSLPEQPRKQQAEDEASEPHAELFTSTTSSKSRLLLRMAALQQANSRANAIDDSVVSEYFPTWIASKQKSVGQWNQEAVLRDLVMAVSHLSSIASIDTPQKTNEHAQ